MAGFQARQGSQLLVRHGGLLVQKPGHMVGTGNYNNIFRRESLCHSLLDFPAHERLPDQDFRAVLVAVLLQRPQFASENPRAAVIRLRVAGMLHGALPEGLMPVLPCLTVQKPVDVHALLLPVIRGLPARRVLRQSQEHLRRQIHETAFLPVLMGPENRLVFRGILREGVQNRPHRRLLGVGQHRYGRRYLGIGKPLQRVVKIAGPLHQHQPGILFREKLFQMPGSGRGEMPDAEYMWMIQIHSLLSIRRPGFRKRPSCPVFGFTAIHCTPCTARSTWNRAFSSHAPDIPSRPRRPCPRP